ncbi:MAG: HlyD family efflux transporter periplasmic adaptor subunit [Planctomycetia bacterium]|nr:HlyD family efflux transporter periplasmic adaptor subunit [Planctomycetia bacterium]
MKTNNDNGRDIRSSFEKTGSKKRSASKSHKRGALSRRLLWLLFFLAVFSGGGYYSWQWFSGKKTRKINVIQVPVVRGTFLHEVVGKGSAESGKNVDIINQVEGSSTIVELIPEGEAVEEGAVLVRLDTQDIDDKVNSQQIKYNSSLATVASSQATLRTAELSLEEYIEGTFEQEWTQIENKIFSNRETQKQNADSVRYSERLLQLGYTTTAQLEIDRVTEQKAINDVKGSLLEQLVLLKYTSEKKITDLLSSIETAKANLNSNTYTNKLDKDRLDHYVEQQKLCTIKAPQAGQVVYANQDSRPGRSESEMIKDGASVRKGQIMIRLPDPAQMQVKAMINEANISNVQVGMKAILSFDAITNKQYKGEVVKVNRYPEIVWMSSAKDYVTIIKINDDTQDIRTGLTAEVRIVAKELENVLLLPVQCIVESGHKTFCLICKEGKWSYKEVLLGPSNDKEVIILKGVNEGDVVVAGARQYKDELTLPDDAEPSLYEDKTAKTEKKEKGESTAAPDPLKAPVSGEMPGAPGEGKKFPGMPGQMPPGIQGGAPGQMPAGMPSGMQGPGQGQMPAGMMPGQGGMPGGQMPAGFNPEKRGKFNRNRENAKKKDENENTELLNIQSEEEVHNQLLRIEPMKKYFELTAMEFCRKLDVNRDKIIKKEEVEKVAPELIPFFASWDRNKDGQWSQTDFVIGFCESRNLYQKSERLFNAGKGVSGENGNSSGKSAFQEWLESNPEKIFAELDHNKDGVLTEKEYPVAQFEFFKGIMKRFDTDSNNEISKEEFQKGFAELKARRERSDSQSGRNPSGDRSGGRRSRKSDGESAPKLFSPDSKPETVPSAEKGSLSSEGPANENVPSGPEKDKKPIPPKNSSEKPVP